MKTKSLFYGFAAALLLAGCGPTTTSSQSASPSESETPSESTTPTSSEDDGIPAEWKQYELSTCAELNAVGATVADGERSTETYYIAATVKEITNPTYGQMVISDETGTFECYGVHGEDDTYFDKLPEAPEEGDLVLLKGQVKNYQGTYEFDPGYLLDFVSKSSEEEINPDDYQLMSVADARKVKDGDYVRIKGTVLRFTYNIKLSEIGFMLADNTASIYVYDSRLAAQVEEGEEVTLVGKKDHWVLEDEQSSADKFGYLGCHQITDCVLVDHQSGADFDYDAVAKETTVRDVVTSDWSEDITSILYKAPVFVDKRVGTGYTNYYLLDLDQTSGSYTYTQANGKDFAWLDDYDQQIVYMYFVALNAKMSSTGGVWRMLPIEVSDEKFTFDLADAPKFVVDYYGVPQIAGSYGADPSEELLTSVSSEILGIANAGLSYSSDDTSAVWFAEEEGKVILHVDPSKNKSVKVTVTGSLAGQADYSATVTVEAKVAAAVETITVKQAIDAADGDKVTVKGVVGPGLVNKIGFYLIDETGVIATEVLGGRAVFDGSFDIGDTVVVEATRGFNGKNGVNSQIKLYDATLTVAEYGDGGYPSASFITGKTLAEILDSAEPMAETAKAYVLEDVTITKVGNQHYTNYYINQGEASTQLYSGGGGYSWVDDYIDETIDIVFAPCNWNNSGLKGCLFSLTAADGTTIINRNNFPTK